MLLEKESCIAILQDRVYIVGATFHRLFFTRYEVGIMHYLLWREMRQAGKYHTDKSKCIGKKKRQDP